MPIPVEVYDFGEDMSLVYEWCANRVLLNIARRFPYIADKDVKGAFEWQAKKLVEFGQCNQENMRIIRDSLKDVPEELARTLEEQIVRSVEKVEPELTGAAKAGLLPAGATVQPLSDSVKHSFQVYYEQAANKMNLVNTVMLDSTQQAYTGVVTDVVTKITNSQRYLNDAAGSVITGVESVNSAMRQAVNRMVENGLTGFVDHAGRRWRPEAYVQMDVRTTVANAARQAAFDRCDEFGSDIIQIDAHEGARPLCYPWQGKLISRADNARDVTDLYGTSVHVYALSETSYGQAAGLFGVNCRHFGTPFIPGFSGLMNKDLIQPKEENDQRYELSQQQRAMEREIRDARLKQSVAKARGDEEEAQRAKQRVAELTDRIEEFCESNGLPRRRDREYTPVNATWPKKTGPLPYNVQPFVGNAAGGNATGEGIAKSQTPAPKHAGLTPAEREAVESYVSGETMYINQVLRGRAGQMTADDKNLVKLLDSALSGELGKKTTLYRSVDAEAVFGKINAIQYENIRDAVVYHDTGAQKRIGDIIENTVGKTILEKGYMSTTKDFETASEWGGYTGSEKPIVLRFKTPSGIHGLDLKDFEVEDEEQYEVLLSRGQKYRITGISGEDGSILIDAELIEEE